MASYLSEVNAARCRNAVPAARDSVYDLHFTFRHTGSTLKIRFKGLGLQTEMSPTGIRDESWGIDDLKVSAGRNPVELFATRPARQQADAARSLVLPGVDATGTISDLSAGGVVQANADYDEFNTVDGSPVTDKTEVVTHPRGANHNFRLFDGHHVVDRNREDARDSELMHATMRLQQFGHRAGGKVRYGLTMPGDVKMWQWWPNGNSKSGSARRQTTAHWGLVIGDKYSRPVTPGQDIFYRIEGITEATLNQIKVYVFDADVENPPPLGIDDIPPGADGDPVQLVDTYLMRVQQADLDGDTDGSGAIDGSDAEELREDRGGFVAVPLRPTTDDPGVAPTDAGVYAPVRLTIDPTVDVATARFAFPRDSRLSLWTPWTGTRNDAPVTAGGNAVPGDAELSAAQLGLSNTVRTVTLYAQATEALTASLELVLDPDGTGAMAAAPWDVLPARAGGGGPVTVTVIAEDPEAREAGQDPASVSFIRTGSTAQRLEVFFERDTLGSATADDYEPLPRSVVFEEGASAVELPIVPVDDGDVEGLERLTLQVVPGVGYLPGMPSTAAVTIVDDGSGPGGVTIGVLNDPPTTPVTATIVNVGITWTIPAFADGGTLQAVDIVPPVEEESGSSYVFGADFDGTSAASGDAILTFAAAAPYGVRVTRSNGVKWFLAAADTGFGDGGFRRDAVTAMLPVRLVRRPSADLILIADNGPDDKFTTSAKLLYPNATLIENWIDALDAIQNKFLGSGNLQNFSLMIVGHGGPAAIAIGQGVPADGGPLPGRGIANEHQNGTIQADTAAFMQAMANACTSVYLAGCSVALAEPEDAATLWKDDGVDFAQDLSNGGGQGFRVIAWDSDIAFSYRPPASNEGRPSGLWNVDGGRRREYVGQ